MTNNQTESPGGKASMRKRYRQLKKLYGEDCILIFRNGDGYAVYGDDAMVCACFFGRHPQEGEDGLKVIEFAKEDLYGYMRQLVDYELRTGIFEKN